MREYIICNYPGRPHVVAAIWPCSYILVLYLLSLPKISQYFSLSCRCTTHVNFRQRKCLPDVFCSSKNNNNTAVSWSYVSFIIVGDACDETVVSKTFSPPPSQTENPYRK